MKDRQSELQQFLAKTEWATWSQSPIAVDASARRYLRLLGPKGETKILMDADPSTGESITAFVRIASLLQEAQLAAPKNILHDTGQGFMLLDDLGLEDFAIWLSRHPTDAPKLYKAATDVLIRLHYLTPVDDLKQMNPQVAAEMVAITPEWYADQADATPLVHAMRVAMKDSAGAASTIALRDFHAENLIWRPDLTGTDRVGLLDFQDAFLAPSGYDLVSLLRDARRDVDDVLAQELITYFANETAQDPLAFAAQCACLSVQRNLRILGVFARLIRRDHKPKYAKFMHRVWGHIQTDLAHPALHELRIVVNEMLPTPETSTIAEHL